MKKVVSMSRRTDMRWHANELIQTLQKKYPPERVHTIVCWTKFPDVIFKAPFRDVLKHYDQIYVQLTITGFGGSPHRAQCTSLADSHRTNTETY